jgi:hypothetical protein
VECDIRLHFRRKHTETENALNQQVDATHSDIAVATEEMGVPMSYSNILQSVCAVVCREKGV